MANAICLQDWVTTSGGTTTMVIQPEGGYVDVGGYQDVAIYAEIAVLTNGILLIQTSPTRDSPFFNTLLNQSGGLLSFTTGGGVQAVQLARWADGTGSAPSALLRWVASNNGLGGAWSMTFRLWLGLNQAHP